MSAGDDCDKLFPQNVPAGQWVQFPAAGYACPVYGYIYDKSKTAVSGMPVGGIGTGCLDIETNGTWGYSTIFSHAPGHDYCSESAPNRSRGKLGLPFLGLVYGREVHVLADMDLKGTVRPKQVRYWGHYPIADIEYDLSVPISAAARMWAPFVPGDIRSSSIPGAVFEIRVRNESNAPCEPDILFAFPGPCQEGEQADRYAQEPLICDSSPDISGITVTGSNGMNYTIAVSGGDAVHFGGAIDCSSLGWQAAASGLPKMAAADPGASLSVRLRMEPATERRLYIMLGWHAPGWNGYKLSLPSDSSGNPLSFLDPAYTSDWKQSENFFRYKYTDTFRNSAEAAAHLVDHHRQLQGRVIGWQQEIYSDRDLMPWLKDSLINTLHLLTEDGFWAAAGGSLGSWVDSEAGLFGLCESPVADAQIECIPCSWYGNLPIVYFFPELAVSSLKGYREYMTEEGDVPFVFGAGFDMAAPGNYRQRSLNGLCYADLVNRVWHRTQNDEILQQFYPSVKRSTLYTMSLCPGPDGTISLAEGNVGGDEWYEIMPFFGMVAHVAGLRIAQLEIAKNMAMRAGDAGFAAQCDHWLRRSRESLESQLWEGGYYYLYNEPSSGKFSDYILAFQLDGQWVADFHALPEAFDHNRTMETLETIRTKLNTEAGVITMCHRDGSRIELPEVHERMKGMASWPASIFILAAIYAYKGRADIGLEMARTIMETVVGRLGLMWDMPNVVDVTAGNERLIYGCDYYQVLSIWSLPAALKREDIRKAVGPGGLVDRIIKAGQAASARSTG